MKSAVILIKDPHDCLKYETILSNTIELLLRSEITREAQALLVDQINNKPDRTSKLAKYLQIKSQLTKSLYFHINTRIDDVNVLENVLVGFYDLARRIILQLQKSYGCPIQIPIFTQVLFNVSDINALNKEDGKPLYGFDLIVADTKNITSLIQQFNYQGNNSATIKSFELDEMVGEVQDTLFYENNDKVKQVKVGCVGGTFDNLHDGHKILLSIGSFLSTDSLIIGVSIAAMLAKKKFDEFLQSYKARHDTVMGFVKRLKPNDDYKVNIHELNDMYGPTAFVANMDLLLVTEETAKGGGMVNDKRKENGLNELEIFVVKLIEDDKRVDDKISSTFIREGQFHEFEKLVGKVDKEE
ncbi:putative pantetheine-phosphate adenylyltransferase [Saccharomycopsis crataegensis]|uniref:Pantetheine-phosphate adenylyltransferase n=1 Tax=Saccharomycopsis crataegensis TaxID=43959 RepID=A0AAV5QHR7_9ASCO|nr:putative pantetheine-phosphate adenylyltransferase [Saccharomycopsis crataegensis]